MRNVILMQILQPQHQLPKILPRYFNVQRDRRITELDVHYRPARHEFQYEVQRVRGGDVDCFVQQDELCGG